MAVRGDYMSYQAVTTWENHLALQLAVKNITGCEKRKRAA